MPHRLGRWHLSAELAMVLCVAGFVLFGATRCQARRDGAADARIAHAQATAYRLAMAYRSQRDSTDKVVISHKQSSDNLRRMEARFTARSAALTDSLAALRGELADTALTTEQLRGIAERAIQQAAEFQAVAVAAMDSVQSYRNATDALVAAFHVERAAADSALRAKQSEVDALTGVGACRILAVIPCPSRTQSFFAGGGAVLLLLIL